MAQITIARAREILQLQHNGKCDPIFSLAPRALIYDLTIVDWRELISNIPVSGAVRLQCVHVDVAPMHR